MYGTQPPAAREKAQFLNVAVPEVTTAAVAWDSKS